LATNNEIEISRLPVVVTSRFAPRVRELLDIQEMGDRDRALFAQHSLLEGLSLVLCGAIKPDLSDEDKRKADQIGSFYFAPSILILETLYEKAKGEFGRQYSLPVKKESIPSFGESWCESAVIRQLLSLVSEQGAKLER
jgi:hypothetical protein